MMRLFISSAKKMRADVDFLQAEQLPQLLSKACELLEYCRGLTVQELKKLLCCNDGIAALNYERYRDMVLEHAVTPALLAFDGIQYQYMAPQLFTEEQFGYVRKRLYILSGFYGILRPFDGVLPYRLEMQAKIKFKGYKSLYEFWGAEPAKKLISGEEVLVNLASKEYARTVLPYLPEEIRCVTPVFGELEEGRVVEKGVYVKMARGEMVRFLAERQAENPEEMQAFQRLGYHFCPERSDRSSYVFLRQAEGKGEMRQSPRKT